MTPRDDLLHELSGTLRGARRARQRLLDEIAEDLKDAIDYERARGMAPDAAEALVARRFGKPAVVATLWNREQTMRRRAIRRNLLVLMVAVATAGGLGITQYASGKNSLTATRASRVIRGYGMSLTVPDDWSGRITHGLVRLRGAGVRIEIRESSPTNRLDPFFRRRSVPALRASDFRSAEHHLGFTLACRHFAVLPFPPRPSQAAIDVANSALRSFTVRSGKHYGQPLAPLPRGVGLYRASVRQASYEHRPLGVLQDRASESRCGSPRAGAARFLAPSDLAKRLTWPASRSRHNAYT